MKSSRQVERIVGRTRLKADRVTDERILSDASAALAKTINNRPQALPPGPTIWRTIMESKVTRYSVAATILVAAALILTNPCGFFGDSQGVVLAEVVEKMSEVETIVHKEKRVYYEVGKDEPLLKADVVKYVSSRQGIVEEQYDQEGNLQYRVYIQKEPRQLIFVFVREKQYLKLPMGESWARLMDRGLRKIT